MFVNATPFIDLRNNHKFLIVKHEVENSTSETLDYLKKAQKMKEIEAHLGIG